uniref:GATA-type domain-containing protein n=1 Tax=Oryza meridionalis TaxID=40149 RepID=A0A0E0CI19_9ORYZ
MSTIYMSQLPATLPLMEGDQDQGLYPAFHRAKDPPILFPFMIDSAVEHQGQSYGDQGLRRQQVLGESNQQFNDHMMMGGSDVFLAPFRPTIQSIGSDMIQRSSYDPYDIESNNKQHANGSTSKWMSTPPVKMRIIRKGAATDPEGGAVRKPRRRAQAHQDESQQQQQQALGVVRVCSDCNTTKTPLWRSGPCGPKSLCNACGIRQRKARRAMAAAANGGAAVSSAKSVTAAPVNNKPAAKKEKRAADVDRSLPFKKRCKMVDHVAAAVAATKPTAAGEVVAAAPKKDQDHVIVVGGENAAAIAPAQNPISKAAAVAASPAFFHGLPRDEITDAAMLLMTLSCGLVHS